MYKNHEGYPDNVAGTAIENAEKEELCSRIYGVIPGDEVTLKIVLRSESKITTTKYKTAKIIGFNKTRFIIIKWTESGLTECFAPCEWQQMHGGGKYAGLAGKRRKKGIS